MAQSRPREPRPFTLYLPGGFIDLPLGELSEGAFTDLAKTVADLFDIGETGIDAAASAIMLATVAGAIAEAGASYCAAGLFRSADRERPVLALVHCYVLLSQHHTVNAAIAGLIQLHENQARGVVSRIHMESGPAVVVESVEKDVVTMAGQIFETAPRSVTAWIPDPAGTCVVGIAMLTNNGEDWEQIKDLAYGIFNGFEWVDTEVKAG